MNRRLDRRRRRRRRHRAFAAATALLIGLIVAFSAYTVFGRSAVEEGRVDNVILLIGDGMGNSEITSARNYQYGAGGQLPGIDAPPFTGQVTTYSLTKDGEPDYLTDSAASATAWATGTKTYDGAIGVGVDGEPRESLIELAGKAGHKTGNVTTSKVQDATPAAQVAHVSQRSCQGPDDTSETCPEAAMENGGPGSISEQLLATRPDVMLGGGASTFEEEAEAGTFEGMTLLEQAERRGYQLVNDTDGLDGIERADQEAPLLGLFAEGNLPVSWVGPGATKDGGAKEPVRCQENPERRPDQPSLAEMTEKAIGLLDTDDGFFLQVESASIDKRDHAADACGQIGEVIALDEAAQVALRFAKQDENTLVIVTADHGHSSQIVQAGSTTSGRTVTLLTNEGSPMTLAYGTAPSDGSQQHSGTQVRVAGYGPRSADLAGLTDQTELFGLISEALELPG